MSSIYEGMTPEMLDWLARHREQIQNAKPKKKGALDSIANRNDITKKELKELETVKTFVSKNNGQGCDPYNLKKVRYGKIRRCDLTDKVYNLWVITDGNQVEGVTIKTNKSRELSCKPVNLEDYDLITMDVRPIAYFS